MTEDGKHYCKGCNDQLAVCDWHTGICDACKLGPNIPLQGHQSMLDAFVAAEEAAEKAKKLREQLEEPTRPQKPSRQTIRNRIRSQNKSTRQHKTAGQRIKKAQEFKADRKGADLPSEFFGPKDEKKTYVTEIAS